MKLRRHELLEIIEGGENLETEFKLHFSSSEKIAKEIVAFANTSGGIIIFGVDDYKKIIGVQSEKEEAELFQIAATEFCEPPVPFEIDYFVVDGKETRYSFSSRINTKNHTEFRIIQNLILILPWYMSALMIKVYKQAKK